MYDYINRATFASWLLSLIQSAGIKFINIRMLVLTFASWLLSLIPIHWHIKAICMLYQMKITKVYHKLRGKFCWLVHYYLTSSDLPGNHMYCNMQAITLKHFGPCGRKTILGWLNIFKCNVTSFFPTAPGQVSNNVLYKDHKDL